MNVAMGKSVRQPGYISLVVLTGEMAQAVARKSFLMPMHQFASLIQHSDCYCTATWTGNMVKQNLPSSLCLPKACIAHPHGHMTT